jgi:hypothetical protein
MRVSLSLLLLPMALADKPAVAPAYVAPAPSGDSYGAPNGDQYGAPSGDTYGAPAGDSYGAPSNPVQVKVPDAYGSPAGPPIQDTYGSPSSPPVSQPDSYGSPQAPVEDSYGSPQAAPVQAAAPGNQGYYYYYYPVRQNVPEAVVEDEGLFGGLLGGGGLAGLLSTKVLLLVLGVAGFVLITSLGINLGKRSFTSRALDMAEPYMTTGNLIALLDSVNSAIAKYQ